MSDKAAEVKVENEISKRSGMTIKDGANAKYMNHNLELAYLPPIDTNDVVEVRARCEQYFLMCQEHDTKPSVAGLALALGVNRNTLLSWLKGTYRKPAEVLNIIAIAYNVLNAQIEDYMQDGEIPTVNGIFIMKCNFGYNENSGAVVTETQANVIDMQALIDEAKLLPE